MVAGPGGARADFVAGWLGTLPGFINNMWSIDPLTGVSIGEMGKLRGIDQPDSQLVNVLNNLQLELSPNAEWTWPGACHGHFLDNNQVLPFIDAELVKLLIIDISNVDPVWIKWQFIAKTYLGQRKNFSLVCRNKSWIIDHQILTSPITDKDRILKAKQIIKNFKNQTQANIKTTLPATILDYSKLFCDNGSRYLTESLNLCNVPEYCHSMWNTLLPFANTPDTISAWGVKWHRKDIT
jgi:hypothetical protein